MHFHLHTRPPKSSVEVSELLRNKEEIVSIVVVVVFFGRKSRESDKAKEESSTEMKKTVYTMDFKLDS